MHTDGPDLSVCLLFAILRLLPDSRIETEKSINGWDIVVLYFHFDLVEDFHHFLY